MTATKSHRGTRPPRRLPPGARRRQLVDAASAEIARRGFAEFSLDAVAERADVTRNLLYHYFPRGRIDLFLAALERAGSELTEGWVTDSELPGAERFAENFERVADHVMAQTDSWRVYRQARGLADREVQAVTRRYGDIVLANVSLNQFGTEDPPPLARVGLTAYLAYVEAALDEAREAGVSRADVAMLLGRVLSAAVAAASG
jgi:AcrR family transcriptional regulator